MAERNPAPLGMPSAREPLTQPRSSHAFVIRISDGLLQRLVIEKFRLTARRSPPLEAVVYPSYPACAHINLTIRVAEDVDDAEGFLLPPHDRRSLVNKLAPPDGEHDDTRLRVTVNVPDGFPALTVQIRRRQG
jgi:hypothetical protein